MEHALASARCDAFIRNGIFRSRPWIPLRCSMVQVMFAAMSSGYIEKRRLASGRYAYRARMRLPNGGMASKQFGSRREAAEWLETVEVEGLAGADAKAGDQTLSDFYAASRDLIHHGVRQSTRDWYDAMTRVHVMPRFGDVHLSAIAPAELERWAKIELSLRLKPASVRGCWIALSKILKAAHRLGVLASNPMSGMQAPSVPDNRSAMEFIPKDVLALSMAVEDRYRPLILLLAYGGMRYSEGIGLRLASFGKDFRSVMIDSQMDRHLDFHAPKSVAGVRSVPLPELLSLALCDHVTRNKITERNTLMFTRPDGMPIEYSWFRRQVWAPALAETNLRITPHQLRHFAISMWIASGASAAQVRTWAGHSSSSFTLDRYGHLFPADADAITSRLNDHLR